MRNKLRSLVLVTGLALAVSSASAQTATAPVTLDAAPVVSGSAAMITQNAVPIMGLLGLTTGISILIGTIRRARR
jgi:hypothetical protein